VRRLIGAAFLIAGLAPGCTQQRQAAGVPHPGSVLRVASYAEPTSLNPLLITNTAENFLASVIFDLLVTLDDRGNEIPDLAAVVPTLENGGISKDGLTITYHLRRNVRWHDGVPFTSADVKFTWQAVMNPRNNVVERHGYDQVGAVDTPDRYTVVFHLKRRFAPFVDTVFGESDQPFRIIPQHLLARYPDINRIAFNQQPIGTGPFKVVRWVHGDHVQLAANPQYFRGAPNLRGITVYTVPDGNTASAELRSRGTDLIIDLSSANYRDLQGVAGVRTLLVKVPGFSSIDFNLTHPPPDDVRVRRAIAFAINERRIVDDLTYGTATLATSDLSDFYWAYDPNVPLYPYDMAKAGALLDAAGWKRGLNGFRAKNGKPLSLQLSYGQGSETARQIAVQVQSDLHGVGIDVPLKSYTYTMLYATKAEGGIQQNGKFDLTLLSWVAGADPDDSSLWMCSMVPPRGNNITHYCNARFDAAESTALTHVDRAIRKRAYATTQELLASDAPAAFQYYARLRYAMSPSLQNFAPNGPSEGWNAYRWSL